MENIVLEIRETEKTPDTSNDEELARALQELENNNQNEMYYRKQQLNTDERRNKMRFAAESRSRFNRFKMQFVH